MILANHIKNKKLDRTSRLLIVLVPFLSSCTSNQNNLVEIITPPKAPEEFSFIPEQTNNHDLFALQSAENNTKDFRIGRKDPFLSPQFDNKNLSIPETFKYYGQISSGEKVHAFVSYQDQKGTIKPGDVGGISTDLLPSKWTVESIDMNSHSLKLKFDNSYVILDLFPIDMSEKFKINQSNF